MGMICRQNGQGFRFLCSSRHINALVDSSEADTVEEALVLTLADFRDARGVSSLAHFSMFGW